MALSEKQKNSIALCVGLIACLLLVVAADRGLAMLHRLRAPAFRGPSFYPQGLDLDARLGYRIRPNQHFPDAKWANGELLYEATYTTDEHGRRWTPANDAGTRDAGAILFFGCSFTFGEGVNDDDTLANQVALRMPGYRCYNYGVSGYGTQQLLAKLQSGELRDEVGGEQAILVYAMIPAHVSRAVGTMRILTRWGQGFPYYYLDGEGKPRTEGSFSQERPGYIKWLHVVGSSGFMQYFSLDYPPMSARHFDLAAQLILESQRLFEQQFESLGFVTLFYPTVMERRFSLDPLERRLCAAGATVFDYSDMPTDPELHAVHATHDLHPNATLHALVAERLANDLSSIIRGQSGNQK